MSQINFINEKELEYIMSKGYIENYPNLEKSIHTPRFTIKDLNVTARDATYWDSKDILPKLKTKNTTRRKYTLTQAIWIKIIQQLREFDISINQIKKYKESILDEKISITEAIDDDQISLILEHLAETAGHLEEYKALLKNPDFLKDIQNQTLSTFEMVILITIIFRYDVSYLGGKNGVCIPYSFEKHQLYMEIIPEYPAIMKNPHILISISHAYKQLVEDWSEKIWFENITILSKQELKIIDLIRNEDTAELQIFKQSQTPERVIQVIKNKNLAVKDFVNYIAENGFQTITVSTRKGKVVNFRNEISIKI